MMRMLLLMLATLTLVGAASPLPLEPETTKAHFPHNDSVEKIAPLSTERQTLNVHKLRKDADAGRIEIQVQNQTYAVHLERNDLRGPNFTTNLRLPNGQVIQKAADFMGTYLGHLEGASSLPAVFTIHPTLLQGKFWIAENQLITLSGSDVDQTGSASSIILLWDRSPSEDIYSALATVCNGGCDIHIQTGVNTVAQVVSDATDRYYDAVGERIWAEEAAAINELASSSIWSTHTIEFSHVSSWAWWNTGPSAQDPCVSVDENRDAWLASDYGEADVVRDMVLLFDVDGANNDGCAYALGGFGDPYNEGYASFWWDAYAETDYSGLWKELLLDHEVGHLFNGEHVTGCSSSCTIMANVAYDKYRYPAEFSATNAAKVDNCAHNDIC